LPTTPVTSASLATTAAANEQRKHREGPNSQPPGLTEKKRNILFFHSSKTD